MYDCTLYQVTGYDDQRRKTLQLPILILIYMDVTMSGSKMVFHSPEETLCGYLFLHIFLLYRLPIDVSWKVGTP